MTYLVDLLLKHTLLCFTQAFETKFGTVLTLRISGSSGRKNFVFRKVTTLNENIGLPLFQALGCDNIQFNRYVTPFRKSLLYEFTEKQFPVDGGIIIHRNVGTFLLYSESRVLILNVFHSSLL